MLVNLNDILKDAQQNHYAVGLFNTIDTDMLEAVMTAAEELRSPVIIGTAEVLLPYGELDLLAPALIDRAKKSSVPVVVHYDHGLTFERCMQALKLGFSSVMFDGSADHPAVNIAETANIVRIAHAFGASVEGEIGHVGQADEEEHILSDQYTTPEEALDFIAQTGVDALAIAIGTAHGAYKTKPQLDINRLKMIRACTDTPLVLHGGSGLTNVDFHQVIQNGIAKVNIFTDLCQAGSRAMLKAGQQNLDYLDTRSARVKAIEEVVRNKMQLFGSCGKV